jgi:hypothetical protein
VVKDLEERTISTTDDTDFTDKHEGLVKSRFRRLCNKSVTVRDAILSVMKALVGVASSHDSAVAAKAALAKSANRGKMPLPQKKRPNFIGKRAEPAPQAECFSCAGVSAAHEKNDLSAPSAYLR